jgi:hypothetical protein
LSLSDRPAIPVPNEASWFKSGPAALVAHRLFQGDIVGSLLDRIVEAGERHRMAQAPLRSFTRQRPETC